MRINYSKEVLDQKLRDGQKFQNKTNQLRMMNSFLEILTLTASKDHGQNIQKYLLLPK